MSNSILGFGLSMRYIDHLYTLLVITLIYSAIANLYHLQITTVSAKFFQPAVFSPAVPW
jgi:hypothetical protein